MRKDRPGELSSVQCRSRWLPEPLLRFAGGENHVDPRVGVALWGRGRSVKGATPRMSMSGS